MLILWITYKFFHLIKDLLSYLFQYFVQHFNISFNILQAKMPKAQTKDSHSMNEQQETPHSHIEVGQIYDNSLTQDESSLSHIKNYKTKSKDNNCRPRKIAGIFILSIFVILLSFVSIWAWKNQQLRPKKTPISDNPQTINRQQNQELIMQRQTANKMNEKQSNSSPINGEKIQQKEVKQSNEIETNHEIPIIPLEQPIKPVVDNKQPSQFITVETQVIGQNLQNHIPSRQHFGHPTINPSYPTLGMPIVGRPFNSTQVTFGADYYRYQSLMDEVFKPYNNTNCQFERYGDSTDGGYVLCKNFLNHSVALINLGVQGRDLFGCTLTSEFLMPNYQYDCTNSYAPKCQSNNNMNNFMPICLSDRTQKTIQYRYSSLADFIHSRNLTKKYVTMKIDIQGAQWPGFRTFPTEYLDYVDQFILQIHLSSGSIDYQPVWGNLDIIKSIGEKFISTNLHMNNHACVNRGAGSQPNRFYPSFAIEVTLVNKKLITVNGQTRSYSLNSRNNPNAYFQDCQLKDNP